MQQFTASKIIFDLDGTLIDSAPDLLAATNHVLARVGRAPVNIKQVRHMVGYGALRLIELGLEATGGADGLDPISLRDEFLAYYAEHICVETTVFDGVVPALEQLKARGFQMAICTNKPFALAETVVNKLGLAPYFAAMTGGDTFAFKKPDPRHLFETAARLPGQGKFVMVGDSKPDMDGAKAAEVPAFLVSFGYSAHPLKSLHADVRLDEMAALPAYLQFSGD